MNDRLKSLRFYNLSIEAWKDYWIDSEILLKDLRGKEIARQLVRSIGSIVANIEEGYGRGFKKELSLFLKYARGSARESKGWYERSDYFFSKELIQIRTERFDAIIGMITKTIITLDNKTNK